MQLTNNHRIILLYCTVFILISFITVYLPVWLFDIVGLSYKSIGLLLATTGFLKIFSNIFITISVRDTNKQRNILIFTTFCIIVLFGTIIYIQNQQDKIIIALVFFSLLIFSPTLPLVENICISLTQNFQSSYGKYRLIGSIAFLLSVLIIGFWVDKFKTESLPKLFILCLCLFLFSVLLLPKDKNKIITYKKTNLLKLLIDKKYFLVLISCSIILASHAMYYGFSTIFWNQNNLSYSKIGLLWSWGVFAEIIFFIFINKVDIEKFFFRAILLSGLLSAFRWLMTYFLDNYYLIFLDVFYILHTFLYSKGFFCYFNKFIYLS